MSTTNSGDDILVNKTDIYHQPLKWPSEEDLSGAALALTRLQDTYNLDPNDLAHGKLNGKMIGPTLSAHDCFELGIVSHKKSLITIFGHKHEMKNFNSH